MFNKETPSFAEQMSNIKSSFKLAFEDASNLHSQMEQKIKEKEAQMESLQSDINSINEVKTEAEVFMENISKLI